MSDAKAHLRRLLILVGNSLTVVGCLALVLHVGGLATADAVFAGSSLGIRAVGSVAVTGCLLSAIGYGMTDYLEN